MGVVINEDDSLYHEVAGFLLREAEQEIEKLRERLAKAGCEIDRAAAANAALRARYAASEAEIQGALRALKEIEAATVEGGNINGIARKAIAKATGEKA